MATVSAVLGFIGFKKHQAGQLSWKAVGLGSAFVAAFGTVDYFVSRFVARLYLVLSISSRATGADMDGLDSYLFKRYPPKK